MTTNWTSKKQQIASLSSSDAEYQALSECDKNQYSLRFGTRVNRSKEAYNYLWRQLRNNFLSEESTSFIQNKAH
jgi:hypothetical protein